MAVRDIPVLIELREPNQTFLPSHDRHLIQPIASPNTTVGGLVVPDGSAISLGTYGKIIASGPGNVSHMGQMIPMDHKVGDIVAISPLATRFKVVINRQEFILVGDRDCDGVIVTKETAPIEHDYRGAVPISTADFTKAVSLKNGQMPDGNFCVTTLSGAPLCFSDEGLQACVAKVREYQASLPQTDND